MVLSGAPTAHALDQAERALAQLRSVLTRAAYAQSVITSKQYQLADTDFHDLLVLLLGQRPGIVTVQYGQHFDTTLHLVCFLMPRKGTNGHVAPTQPSDVFIAISGAGHAINVKYENGAIVPSIARLHALAPVRTYFGCPAG